MLVPVKKTHENNTPTFRQENQTVAIDVAQKQRESESNIQFEDKRPEAIQMAKLQEMANVFSQNTSGGGSVFEFLDYRPESIAAGNGRQWPSSSSAKGSSGNGEQQS